MNNEKPLVIVLSRNYSTGLGIIRSLGSAGYDVDLVASVKKKGSSVIASCSRFVRNTMEILSPKIQEDDGSALVDALINDKCKENRAMIIFPTDDFTASIVDAHRDVLMSHFILPETLHQDFTITELMDKTVQAELAKQAGLLTPEEWVVSLKDEICIPEGVVYPCFVKPLRSISGYKTEMAVCDSFDALYTHLHKMKASFCNRDVLIQEFLCIDKEYSMSGICLDEKIILPAIIEKDSIAMHERGVAVTGTLVSVDQLGECKDNLMKLLASFRYRGMFDVDLIQCGNRIYFSEVNLRSGGSNFIYFLNGVNLPDIFVKEMTGNGHYIEDEECTLGKSFVYEKVAWEEFIYGYMSMRELKQCLSNADYTLLNYDKDPSPGKCFEKRIRLSAMKQKLKKIVKK